MAGRTLRRVRRRRRSRDVGETLAKTRRAMARIDQILSGAQQIIGTELSSEEVHTEAPAAFSRATKAFSFIERARRAIQGKR